MSDEYIKGLITGILAAMGIVLLSVLIYFFFFHDALKKAGGYTGYGVENQLEAYEDFVNKESEILSIVKSRFFEKVDDETLYRGAYDGIMEALNDPYSCYYSKEEYDSINQTTDGEYVGIGCYVAQNSENKEIVVLSVIEGSPCEAAGMLAGDIIIGVDDRDISNEELDYAMSFVKGEAGTKVTVKVKRGDEILELSMIRDKIEQKTLSFKLLEDNTGYIKVSSFYKKTPVEFKNALESLNTQGMEKLIVDLRDNPGGLFDTAIDMLDIFLDKDILAAYIEDSEGRQQKSYTKDEYAFDKPVVIMINGNSASASELFTQTMRDYGKAVVIGTKSYGKGIYQNIYTVGEDGSAIKITGGRYYSPEGVCVHGVGIEPDITVEIEKKEENQASDGDDTDNQIQAALDYFKNK